MSRATDAHEPIRRRALGPIRVIDGCTVAGSGPHSHEVPAVIGRVVLMCDGSHEGTEVYRTADGFRFVCLGRMIATSAERCVLVRCDGLAFDQLAEPFACDGDTPEGLALIGVEERDDLSWLGEYAAVIWDSADADAEGEGGEDERLHTHDAC